jgi:hypothetical protein
MQPGHSFGVCLPAPCPAHLQGMIHTPLARWFGHQLADWAPHSEVARLYGITVNDPDLVASGVAGGARFIAIADGDPYDLLDGPSALSIDRYDALALVALGWAHRQGADRSTLTAVMVVSVFGPGESAAFYVRDPATGQEIAVQDPLGDLPFAVARLGALAA